MAMLLLRKAELQVLSLVSGKKRNTFSVLSALEGFSEDALRDNTKAQTEALNDLYKDGAIWKTPEGKPQLIRELQGVFTVLTRPQKTFSFKVASETAFIEHCYSEINDMGVLFSIGKDHAFYTLQYPMKKALLATWFKDDIIGDLGADYQPLRLSARLSQEEFNGLMVLMMHQAYGPSIEQGIPKDKLLSQAFLDHVKDHNPMKIDMQVASKIITHETWPSSLKKLEEKGLLVLKEDHIVIHDALAQGFRAKNLREIVEINERTPLKRAKNIYITNAAYVVVEPVVSKVLSWKIDLLGRDIRPIQLMDALLDFSDFTPNAAFKAEIKKRATSL